MSSPVYHPDRSYRPRWNVGSSTGERTVDMNPLILAVAVAQLAMPPQTEGAAIETEKAGRLRLPPETDRGTDPFECEICLLTYIHNPASPSGREKIREDCGFSTLEMPDVRAHQLQIAVEGIYSARTPEDWGTWYGPHRIESVEPRVQPPCGSATVEPELKTTPTP
jgi:hypothetical protein